MADEAQKRKDLITILKERRRTTSDESLVKALNLRIDYLESLTDPEDIDRLVKKSPELRKFVSDVTDGHQQLESDAKAILDVAMPKRVGRDEKTAKKTIDEKGLLDIVPNNGSVEEIYDPESDYSWYNWTPTQGKAYAKAAGMSYGDFLRKIAEMDTQNQRKRIANDGVSAKALSIILPRVQKDIERDGNVSPASVALDLAESAAQAVPVGRVVGSLPKIGKAYKALKGTYATIGKAVAENAVVPTTFAFADAARNGDVKEGAYGSVLGTTVNMATPAKASMSFRRLGRMGLSGALAKSYEGSTDNVINNFFTNKIGRNKYGQEAIAQITGLDPTGSLQSAVDNFPGSPLNEEKKKKEQQKALDSQHTKNLVNDYNEYIKNALENGNAQF